MESERYKKMYACLCVAMSQAITLLESPNNLLYAKSVLQQALWEAEEMYVSDGEDKTEINPMP